MTSMFKPKIPELPVQQVSAPVSTVTENATDTRKRKRQPPGRQNALMAGIANALKQRLGE